MRTLYIGNLWPVIFIIAANCLSFFSCFAEDFETVQSKTQSEKKILADRAVKFYLWETFEIQSFPDKFTFAVYDKRNSLVVKGKVDLVSGAISVLEPNGTPVSKDKFKVQEVTIHERGRRFVRISFDALFLKTNNSTLQISSSDE